MERMVVLIAVDGGRNPSLPGRQKRQKGFTQVFKMLSGTTLGGKERPTFRRKDVEKRPLCTHKERFVGTEDTRGS